MLINYPMNAYVEAKPVVLRTTVLGVRVEVEASPVSYSWSFGDGGVLVTEDAGGPYPDMTTSHEYRRPGRYRVSLATTYEGRFRVVGSEDWLPVDGTATVGSPAVLVEAEETRAVLVP
ncbi:MAG: PKD domain-containing protein [Kineosporiaceae bacterium]